MLDAHRRMVRTLSLLALKILAITLLLTSGCATTKPEIGQPADEWLSKWGAPPAVAPRADGSRVLTWEHKYFGSFYQTFTCRRNVTVAPDGGVIGYAEVDCGRWF